MRHGRHGPFLTRGMLERAVYRGTLAALRAQAAAPVPDHIADITKMVAAEAAQDGLADAVAELVATLDDVGLAPAPVEAKPRAARPRKAAPPVVAPAPDLIDQAMQQLQDTAARVVPQMAELGQRLGTAFVEGGRRMEESAAPPFARVATPLMDAVRRMEGDEPAALARVPTPLMDAVRRMEESPAAPVARAAKPAQAKPAPAPAKPAFPSPEKDRGGSVATSHQAVRTYLTERLIASGQGKLLASDRVAALTHAEALDRANEYRVRAGQLPFRFLGAAVRAA